MTATVHAFPNAGTPDPFAELHAGRERLGAELTRLAVVDSRATEAEGRLADLEKGIAALDRADREAVEQ